MNGSADAVLRNGAWQVGEVLVLLQPVLAGRADADEDLSALLALLSERNFLLWQRRLDQTGLLDVLRQAAELSGLGCRLELDDSDAASLQAPQPATAVVGCRSHAHLALAVVAERGRRFSALAVGRVVEHGVKVRRNGLLVS